METQQTQSLTCALDNKNLEQKLNPLGDSISSVALTRVSGGDIDVVNAARVSYGKCTTQMREQDAKLIRFLLEHGHTSPFEHNQLSFRVKAPLFVARQWMRHRMHSYNEISYRYVQAPIEFYFPPQWRYQDTKNKQASVGAFQNEDMMTQYKASVEKSYKTYEQLLVQGVCREQARAVLPLCTYTEFIFTSNLHALMHFMKLRLNAGAQKEIRAYAACLLALAIPHFPVSLGIWQEINAATIAPDVKDTFTELFTKYSE
jgi:thymidylate synthase (FAD)